MYIYRAYPKNGEMLTTPSVSDDSICQIVSLLVVSIKLYQQIEQVPRQR
jgi:hypothetical protein